MPPENSHGRPNDDSLLKDLELQWRDHHHMRDQTWKTLTNSALLFLGVVGLEIRGDLGDLVMVPAYVAVLLTALFGWSVASHHRIRQRQKFKMIAAYEQKLGLLELKRDILRGVDEKAGLVDKINTGRFIGTMQLGVAAVAVALLLRRLLSPG